MLATVTSKGQVTIPKTIRSLLNIKASDKVNFTIEGDQVILKAVKSLQDFRGSVSSERKGDIREEREKAKVAVAKKMRTGHE